MTNHHKSGQHHPKANSDRPPHNTGVESNREKHDETSATKHEKGADRTDEYWPNRLTAICAALSVAILFFYTKYAREQVIETRNVIKQSSDQFGRAERPFVAIQDVTDIDAWPLAVNKPVIYRLFYKNSGRSPAVKVAKAVGLFYGEAGFSQMAFTIKHLPAPLLSDKPLGYFEDGTTLIDSGEVMPPSTADTDRKHTDVKTKPMSQTNYDYIIKHDFGMLIGGRIEYQDLTGNTYWTNFCWGRLMTGAISVCPNSNEMK